MTDLRCQECGVLLDDTNIGRIFHPIDFRKKLECFCVKCYTPRYKNGGRKVSTMWPISEGGKVYIVG